MKSKLIETLKELCATQGVSFQSFLDKLESENDE
jgi:hypothetical protein